MVKTKKNEVFVVIADVKERAEVFAKELRRSNIAVKQANSKAELDYIDSEDEILAFIVHPVIESDIPRIKKLYDKPVFVVGDVDPTKLDSLIDHGVLGIYRTVYMPEIYKKLGRNWEFSKPKHSPNQSSGPIASKHKQKLRSTDDERTEDQEEIEKVATKKSNGNVIRWVRKTS